MFQTRRPEPSPRTASTSTKRPTSPTFSAASTRASALNIPGGPDVIITRSSLRTSVNAYEELLRSCTSYRNALSSLSNASSEFAKAIETCSRLKGTGDDASIGLQAISGVYYLIGNQERVLGDSIRTQFDEPLRAHLHDYKARIAERSAAYEQSLVDKNRIIQLTEQENMATGKRKQRDLNSFRAALATLQRQVQDLDQLKAEYYTEVLAHEEEVWDAVMEKVALTVRSSLEVYDRIATKSSDPSLEPILQAIPDPFDAYGPLKNEDQIYSILPVGSILSSVANDRSASPSPSPHNMTYPHQIINSKISEASNETEHDKDVRTWMDKTAAAREAAPDLTSSSRSLITNAPNPITGVTTDWYTANPFGAPVDWSDAGDVRARRHSLPTDPQAALASTSHDTSRSNDLGVPFPSFSSTDASPSTSENLTNGTSTLTKKKSAGKSKLRQTLSAIGEVSGASEGHSRESTLTVREAVPGENSSQSANEEHHDGADAADDDDAATERESSRSEPPAQEDQTARLDSNEAHSSSQADDEKSTRNNESSETSATPSTPPPEPESILPTATGAFQATEAVV